MLNLLHLFTEKSVPALPGPSLSQAVFVKVLESREGIEVRDAADRDFINIKNILLVLIIIIIR